MRRSPSTSTSFAPKRDGPSRGSARALADLVWTPLARADLLRVYRNLARESPAAAERYLDLIERRAGMLAAMPLMGPRRPDIRPSARLLVVAPYLILYETEPDAEDGPVAGVTVVRVVDGRRDLARLLRPR